MWKQKLRKQQYLNLDNIIKILNKNLSKEELAALAGLSKNKGIVMRKSDNGNSVVIVEKEAYIKRMKNLFSVQRKFEWVTLKNDAFPNFVAKPEKRMDTLFNNLVDSNSMSKEMCISIKPVETRPGTMYRLCT